jgi:hypothetical protein
MGTVDRRGAAGAGPGTGSRIRSQTTYVKLRRYVATIPAIYQGRYFILSTAFYVASPRQNPSFVRFRPARSRRKMGLLILR